MGVIEQPLLLQRHRITADEYQLMGRSGVLAPDARVELIDGEVIDMASIGIRHWATVNRLQRLLERAIGDQAVISQASMRLGTHSEPQPDLALFKPRDDFYLATGLPAAADALLVIEVADSSVRYDREIKMPLYARHGISELWIFDLDVNLLRMYREPVGDRYLQTSETAQPGVVGIAALPGIRIDLTGMFA